MTPIKSLIAGALFALTATAAIAEVQSHEVHRFKDWHVDFNQGDNFAWCSAATGNFHVNANQDGSYELQVVVPGAAFSDYEAPFSIQVDRGSRYIMSDATYIGVSIFSKNIKEEVVIALATGGQVHTFNTVDEYVESFTLAGSKAAIIALYECQQKLPAPQTPTY